MENTAETKTVGRPRKLREEIPVAQDQDTETKPKKSQYDYLKPYIGRDSIVPGEPRFFVNKNKLIRVIKKQHGVGDDGKPQYLIMRSLFANVNDNTPAGRRIRAVLKSKDIPGA